MKPQTENETREAVRGAVVKLGIRATARSLGVERWTVRRIVRGAPVNPGTLAQARERLALLEAGDK